LAVFTNNRINIELYYRFPNKPKPARLIVGVKQSDTTINTSDDDIAGDRDSISVIFSEIESDFSFNQYFKISSVTDISIIVKLN
jgi:hypothetical protein